MKELIYFIVAATVISCGGTPTPAEYPMPIGTHIDYDITTTIPDTAGNGIQLAMFSNAYESIESHDLSVSGYPLTYSFSFNTTKVDQKLQLWGVPYNQATIKATIKINGTIVKEASTNNNMYLSVNM